MFGPNTSRFLTLASVLALTACGGGDETDTTTTEDEHAGGEHAEHHGEGHGEGHHGEGHGEGHGDHHSEAPPTVVAFHDVLAPAWHSEPGETRRDAGCSAVAGMRDAATAVSDAEAPGEITGTSEEWATAVATLGSAVDELGTTCEQSPDGAEDQLSAVHDAFHALTEQLPRHD